jgi:hypothetical protein
MQLQKYSFKSNCKFLTNINLSLPSLKSKPNSISKSTLCLTLNLT